MASIYSGALLVVVFRTLQTGDMEFKWPPLVLVLLLLQMAAGKKEFNPRKWGGGNGETPWNTNHVK